MTSVILTHGNCCDGYISAALLAAHLIKQGEKNIKVETHAYGAEQKYDPLSITHVLDVNFPVFTSIPEVQLYIDHHATAKEDDRAKINIIDTKAESTAQIIVREFAWLQDNEIAKILEKIASTLDQARLNAVPLAWPKKHLIDSDSLELAFSDLTLHTHSRDITREVIQIASLILENAGEEKLRTLLTTPLYQEPMISSQKAHDRARIQKLVLFTKELVGDSKPVQMKAQYHLIYLINQGESHIEYKLPMRYYLKNAFSHSILTPTPHGTKISISRGVHVDNNEVESKRAKFDCASIAKYFSGGGHKYAAGAFVKNKKIIEILGEFIMKISEQQPLPFLVIEASMFP